MTVVAAELLASIDPKLAPVTLAWPQIVGDTLAARSCPVRVVDGTLHVQVAGASWAAEFRHSERTVVDRIAATKGAPDISRIRTTLTPHRELVNPGSTVVDEPAQAPAPRSLDSVDPARAERAIGDAVAMTSPVSDDDVRASLTRAIVASRIRHELDDSDTH